MTSFAQLDLPQSLAPNRVLDLLHAAIAGDPGTRYHGKTIRNTRCVTVQYSDKMHLDVTPMVRRPLTVERESWLFHHRPEDSTDHGEVFVANPFGFAAWFMDTTPVEDRFAEAFGIRERAYRDLLIQERAEADPVPVQEATSRKSRAVIALQLLKRWRNLIYDGRSGRRPPSIVFSTLVAEAANATSSLSEEVSHQAHNMLYRLQGAHRQGHLIHIANPVCDQDVLTDRWPSSLPEQAVLIGDLESLVQHFEELFSGIALDEMQTILARLFGEAPATGAVRELNRRLGATVASGESQHLAPSGRIAIAPAVATAARPGVNPRSTPKHTFFGRD